MAHRVGRGITLLFHDCGTRVVSSTPRPHFTPGKDSVPIVQEAGWAPELVSRGGKSRPHRDIFFKLELLLSFSTQIQWLHGRYLSNVLLTDYCPCVRIALFVCYRRPLRGRRYGGDVIGRKSPCRDGTVTQLSYS